MREKRRWGGAGEIVTKRGERGELWRINNRRDLSKASLMGCDRNLFTLRLVLNQTQGEWRWQAAAQGWGRGGRWKCTGLPLQPPPPCRMEGGVISKAFGTDIKMEGWEKGCEKGPNNEWCAADSLSHAPDGMIIKQSRATMNHSSSVLQNTTSVSQTESRPANQSVERGRKEAESLQLGCHALHSADKNPKLLKNTETGHELALSGEIKTLLANLCVRPCCFSSLFVMSSNEGLWIENLFFVQMEQSDVESWNYTITF